MPEPDPVSELDRDPELPSRMIDGTPELPIIPALEELFPPLEVPVVDGVTDVDVGDADPIAAEPGATRLALPPMAPGVPGVELDDPTPDDELVVDALPGATGVLVEVPAVLALPGAVPEVVEPAVDPEVPPDVPPDALDPVPPEDPPDDPPLLCAETSAVPASRAATVKRERDLRAIARLLRWDVSSAA